MREENDILEEGRNCWKIRDAERAAFLVDAASYFAAIVSAIEQAQKSIYIAAWDIDSRVRLIRSEGGTSTKLGDLLNSKVKGTPGLRAYILGWDFSMVFAMEREWLPVFRLGWKAPRRMHFSLDQEHPTGGSQHQKLVIIDDRLAFSGGIDLTKNRWDTPEHLAQDPRRCDPDGKLYEPFHDVQMVVEGGIGATLGDLFRDRWLWATGEKTEPEKSEDPHVPWPRDLEPDLRNVRVAVARTMPAYKGRAEVREVETLYHDAIRAAKKYIYLENQYLTSEAIVQSLAERLKEENPPELVLVLPKKSSGWLEQSTMDALRFRLLKQLFDVDRHHRLRVFYPALQDGGDVYVHAKVLIVDDRFVRVGSANLSNRSMGLDSECDLAIESTGTHQIEGGVISFRNRLLAEHLGASTEAVDDLVKEKDSIIQAIASFEGESRALKSLDLNQDLPVNGARIFPDTSFLDPERPAKLDQMIDQFVHEEDAPSRKYHVIRLISFLAILLGLAAAWRWTPLSDWINMDTLASWARVLEAGPFSLPGVIGAYIAGSLVMFPVTLLIGTTAIVFSPLEAPFYALAGCLSSALLSYVIGSGLGKKSIQKIAGKRLNRLSKRLAKQGFLTVVIVRNLPLAPFTVVNMVAGASRIRFRDYLLGTVVGMMPGILAITVFADRLALAVQDPDPLNVAVAGGAAVVLGFGMWWIGKRLSRKDRG